MMLHSPFFGLRLDRKTRQKEKTQRVVKKRHILITDVRFMRSQPSRSAPLQVLQPA